MNFLQKLRRAVHVALREIGPTWYEEGQRHLLRKLLEKRFGPLTEPAHQRFRQLSADQLAVMVEQILEAQSLTELGLED